MFFKEHAPLHFHIITSIIERVALVIETLGVLGGSGDGRDLKEALDWAKADPATLRFLWREYSE
jgi:hypothetical protein